jgi:hypothetical protein
MKKLSSMLAMSLFAASAFGADAEAKSEVKAAARKLADQANYSWTTTMQSDGGGGGNFRPGPTDGKLEKGGWIHTKSSVGDNQIETVIKGDKGAMKREDEWLTATELEGDDRGAFMARRMKNFKAPAAEAEELVGHVQELKKGDGGVYSGDLTEAGVKALFARAGRRGGGDGPTGAKGNAKFWLKDGVLSKFEYNVQGSVKRRDSDEEIKVNRTTTTEIKNVGTTTVTVPEAAKKKLS